MIKVNGMASVYKVNKGINKPIEFRGLKGQYIWYLCVGVLALLVVFAFLYIIGINSFICLGIILALGTFTVIKVYQLSDKYGEHGMMKALAKRSVPKVVKSKNRKLFKQLNSKK